VAYSDEVQYIFMAEHAVYNGKTIDLRQKMKHILRHFKDNANFCGLVVLPQSQHAPEISPIPKAVSMQDFVSCAASGSFEFEKVGFNDPLLIAYSSGTTGSPKCIVHSVGGALICSAKESILHSEVSFDSVVLQYTTTGWIMYFLQIANLFAGAQLLLYDGSPFQPDAHAFINLLAHHKVTKFGTSPRWMREIQNRGIAPRDVCDLSNLRTVSSTGMILSEQQFEWFYDVAFPPSVHLANISGGTDIAGCFGAENPLAPVYVGGTQGPSLGVEVAAYAPALDSAPRTKGEPVEAGTPGELVACKAFPNMPPFFWNDVPSPDSNSKYFNAYFQKYDDVWTQGDSVVFHPITGQIIFLGRADGVLNPSGIRFGSAEIYSVLDDRFGDQVADSICVGQKRPADEDESVFLFLKMKPGASFTPDLVAGVKTAIHHTLSPRHVPKFVFETPEIPVGSDAPARDVLIADEQ
jgi:acetoacetyl-CoA synthetase